MSDPDESRRLFLLRALAAGMLGATPAAFAGLLGKVPRALPSGQSVYSVRGEVTVNGVAASEETRIGSNDKVVTGPGGQAIFVVGKDAFLLREKSELQLGGDGLLVDSLRLLTGAVLSVFGKGRHDLATANATVGIRGTGVYLESSPDLSYICTCYGIADIAATLGARDAVTVESRHHDAAKYVTGDGRVTMAPFINHTDEELMLIETLVGRTPPFALFDDSYGGPRRY